jgi:hypothetical protein
MARSAEHAAPEKFREPNGTMMARHPTARATPTTAGRSSSSDLLQSRAHDVLSFPAALAFEPFSCTQNQSFCDTDMMMYGGRCAAAMVLLIATGTHAFSPSGMYAGTLRVGAHSATVSPVAFVDSVSCVSTSASPRSLSDPGAQPPTSPCLSGPPCGVMYTKVATASHATDCLLRVCSELSRRATVRSSV